MANSTESTGKSTVTVSNYTVTNRTRQTLEYRLNGVWYRWTPAGSSGCSQTLTETAIDSDRFKEVAGNFSVKAVK